MCFVFCLRALTHACMNEHRHVGELNRKPLKGNCMKFTTRVLLHV